jgi:TRAP-type C4-dicarboxylate transport system substrate-binding protein
MRSTVGTRRQGLGLGLAAVSAAGFAIRRTWAQDTVVRAVGTQDLHAVAAAVDRLADGIAQTSRGRVAIVIEPDAPDTGAVIAGLRTGEAKLGWIRVSEIVDLVPEVAALSVPFLFRDPQKALAIFDEASLGPLLEDQIPKQGLEPLGYLNVGALRLAAAAPLSIPDLRGAQEQSGLQSPKR